MHLCEQNIIKSLIYTSDNSTYSLTQHENSVLSMLSYRALTVYIYIYIYIYIYSIFNIFDMYYNHPIGILLLYIYIYYTIV